MIRFSKDSRPDPRALDAHEQSLKALAGDVDTLRAITEQQLANLMNLVDNERLAAGQREANITACVKAAIAELRIDLIDAQLATRGLLARTPDRADEGAHVPPPTRVQPLERQRESLRARAPRAFALWDAATAHAERIYRSQPEGSLSTENNIGARRFCNFIAPLLTGRVLDIGCGSIAVPRYLAGYPHASIAGIDPFGDPAEHPFRFVRSFAEFLPWDDATFDRVVAATSLDHVLLLDETFDEIRRVLKPDGLLLIWISFVPGARPYDPFSEQLRAEDEFHVFHFDRPWFDPLFARHFIVDDVLSPDGSSFFYVARQRPCPSRPTRSSTDTPP